MKKIKLLTSLSTLGVLGGGVAVSATSCSCSNEDKLSYIFPMGNVVSSTEEGGIYIMLYRNNTNIALLPNTVEVSTDNDNLLAMGISASEGPLNIIYLMTQPSKSILPEGKDSITVNCTIKALLPSNEEISVIVPIVIKEHSYSIKPQKYDDILGGYEHLSGSTFLNDGNIDIPSEELQLSYYDFDNEITSARYTYTTESLTITPTTAANDKIKWTKTIHDDFSQSEYYDKLEFTCDKDCQPGFYQFTINAKIKYKEAAGNEDEIEANISLPYTVAVVKIKPSLMGVINEKSLIKEGYNVEVSTNDNLAFDISAENYMYYMQAVSSGFYSLKATKKGESGLPTGIKELKNDAVLGYNLEVTSDFTGSAEIEVKLQGQPEENSDPVTYATLTFKVTKK